MPPRAGRRLLLAMAAVCAGAGLAAAPSPRPSAGRTGAAPSILLITLDTTRADHVGPRAGGSLTPNLDALAARGMRYTRALTSSPLTLPAHCSLLSGLDPTAHGVHDNGTAILPSDVPTLATVLSARGYTTGAFVASRVLDRRFGLARGFATYDDAMTAERMGELGYPERDAAAVTTAALGWAARVPAGRPVVPLDPLLRRARAIPAAGRAHGRDHRGALRGRGGVRGPRDRPAAGRAAQGSGHRGRGGRSRGDARRARRGRPRHLPVSREPRGAADPGRPRRPARRRAHAGGRQSRPARDAARPRRRREWRLRAAAPRARVHAESGGDDLQRDLAARHRLRMERLARGVGRAVAVRRRAAAGALRLRVRSGGGAQPRRRAGGRGASPESGARVAGREPPARARRRRRRSTPRSRRRCAASATTRARAGRAAGPSTPRTASRSCASSIARRSCGNPGACAKRSRRSRASWTRAPATSRSCRAWPRRRRRRAAARPASRP